MINFFKMFDNTENYSTLIEEKVLKIKNHFQKISTRNKKITTKNVMDYLKENKAKINILDDQPKKKTDQFNFTFYEDLKPFLFIIFLNNMPKFFCIEVIGNDDYEGFLLSSDSNYKKIIIKDDYVDFILKNKPTKLAKLLKNELIKKKNFIEV